MIVKQNGLSSAHATFVEEAQLPLFEAAGWLIRQDSQFHWTNRGYGSFDDFLLNLSSRKRKDIRKERAAAVAGLEIVHLTGGEISERSEEHTSELQSLMRSSYAVFYLKKKRIIHKLFVCLQQTRYM